ncbi:MAG: hypothetical protein B6245_03160 [Desulfobacteraceae bacterium 4572_88]|nr:MAG: hypothetical protein B6245_03160 [Desulfobacteraceae bacterium 4572_88]RLC15186.1 MAG: hypothetical protein DRI57_13275 [Deltaproteobacteria bacterium]
MTQESHDHNFKNVFLDFPEEALEWLLPQVLKEWGPVRHVEFVRQEPKKQRLSNSHLALDMPILFSFDQHQLLLWLVEFQEDKSKFSVYKILHYTANLMEAHPKATVVPTVLFTDRKKWRKDVMLQLESEFASRLFLHFEYVFVKLFDFSARDYYDVPNPVIKILLPKMNYAPEERWEVIRQAYIGLFQLASAMLFDKYMDFIDVYAEVREEERDAIFQEIKEHKEIIMIKQILRDEYIQEGNIMLLSHLLTKKYHVSPEGLAPRLEGLSSEALMELGEHILECDSFEDIQGWIRQRKQTHSDN